MLPSLIIFLTLQDCLNFLHSYPQNSNHCQLPNHHLLCIISGQISFCLILLIKLLNLAGLLVYLAVHYQHPNLKPKSFLTEPCTCSWPKPSLHSSALFGHCFHLQALCCCCDYQERRKCGDNCPTGPAASGRAPHCWQQLPVCPNIGKGH